MLYLQKSGIFPGCITDAAPDDTVRCGAGQTTSGNFFALPAVRALELVPLFWKTQSFQLTLTNVYYYEQTHACSEGQCPEGYTRIEGTIPSLTFNFERIRTTDDPPTVLAHMEELICPCGLDLSGDEQTYDLPMTVVSYAPSDDGGDDGGDDDDNCVESSVSSTAPIMITARLAFFGRAEALQTCAAADGTDPSGADADDCLEIYGDPGKNFTGTLQAPFFLEIGFGDVIASTAYCGGCSACSQDNTQQFLSQCCVVCSSEEAAPAFCSDEGFISSLCNSIGAIGSFTLTVAQPNGQPDLSVNVPILYADYCGSNSAALTIETAKLTVGTALTPTPAPAN